MHDAEMNYDGSRLATCASDHIVKVFDVKPSGQTHILAELMGHEGPVWQVCWSYPFKEKGEFLASCSHDKKVYVWKDSHGKWSRVYEYNQHEASINSVAWAPPEYGAVFACCSTDCHISVVKNYDDIWKPVKIYTAHDQGVNAVSWAPARASRSIINAEDQLMPQRIVSGGNDKQQNEDQWLLEVTLEGHMDWVRDVAWSPVETYNHFTIASCGLDGQVIVWRTDNIESKIWKKYVLSRSEEPVYNVSWSPNGTVLAVASSDNKVTLFQERVQNEWVQISDVAAEAN